MPKVTATSFFALALLTSVALGAGKNEPVFAHFTDHYTIEVDAPPETVWAHVKHLYVDGERSLQQGAAEVLPITDDISAYLGGLRVIRRSEGGVISESRTTFSAIDDKTMFLSMHMSGTPSGGASPQKAGGIYMTHDVRPAGRKSEWQVIIHTLLEVQFEAGEQPSAELVRKKMAELFTRHNRQVGEILEKQKDAIEKSR